MTSAKVGNTIRQCGGCAPVMQLAHTYLLQRRQETKEENERRLEDYLNKRVEWLNRRANYANECVGQVMQFMPHAAGAMDDADITVLEMESERAYEVFELHNPRPMFERAKLREVKVRYAPKHEWDARQAFDAVSFQELRDEVRCVQMMWRVEMQVANGLLCVLGYTGYVNP
jgi:hypothetical protein